MRLLNAIYDSPIKLLQKATRDGEALTRSLSVCDESAVRDSLFNFAVSAYHLLDWIKAFRPDLKDTVSALLDSSAPLRACRDLCNASKHINLTLNRGPYQTHPAVVGDVRLSATAAISMPNAKDVLEQAATQGIPPASLPPWRLKIQMKDGDAIRAEDLVSDILGVWRRFFADHHIK